MTKHEIDHEVYVSVEGGSGEWKLTAVSLEHKISSVSVWECPRGSSAPRSIGTWARGVGAKPFAISGGTQILPPPKRDTFDPPIAKQEAYKVVIDLPARTGFPICVDVYEEGAKLNGGTAEPADVHRHGWFTENGRIKDAEGPASRRDDCEGWYGLLEAEESPSLPAPAKPPE
jgi:hypothetical protein